MVDGYLKINHKIPKWLKIQPQKPRLAKVVVAGHRWFGHFNLEVPVGNILELVKVTKEDLKRSKTNLETGNDEKGIEPKSFEE